MMLSKTARAGEFSSISPVVKHQQLHKRRRRSVHSELKVKNVQVRFPYFVVTRYQHESQRQPLEARCSLLLSLSHQNGHLLQFLLLNLCYTQRAASDSYQNNYAVNCRGATPLVGRRYPVFIFRAGISSTMMRKRRRGGSGK